MSKKILSNQNKYNPKNLKPIADYRWNTVSNALNSLAKYSDPSMKQFFDNFKNNDAQHLIYRTILNENELDRNIRKQYGGGPALGITQVEPISFIDNMDWLYQKRNDPRYKQLIDNINSHFAGRINEKDLQNFKRQQDQYIRKIKDPKVRAVLQKNIALKYQKDYPYIPYQLLENFKFDDAAILAARLKYLRSKGSIPSAKDPEAQYKYWAKYYNTRKKNQNYNSEKGKEFQRKRKQLINVGDSHASNNYDINQQPMTVTASEKINLAKIAKNLSNKVAMMKKEIPVNTITDLEVKPMAVRKDKVPINVKRLIGRIVKENNKNIEKTANTKINKLEDLFEAIYNEDKKYWPHGLNLNLYNGDKDKIKLIKDKDNNLAGFTAIQVRDNTNKPTAFYSVGVLPAYRGHGLASKFLKELIEENKDKDYAHTYTVHKDNKPSLALYNKLVSTYPNLILKVFN
jgi:ribosomal protein S18 acetylase RimI-like enzyme